MNRFLVVALAVDLAVGLAVVLTVVALRFQVGGLLADRDREVLDGRR